MANTYTWTLPAGSAAPGNTASDWSPSGGPPNIGDTGILTNGGTILLSDGNLQSNLLLLGNGRLVFSGDSLVNYGNPSLDTASVLTTNTGTNVATSSTIDALGNFVNGGMILAAGAAGSTLTINIGTTVAGTVTAPGYFYNPNLIEAEAGNTLTVNIAASSEWFNPGQIVANGGSVVISANTASIAGGYAPVLGFAVIRGGGYLETNASYASTAGTVNASGTPPDYAFADTTAGNTLKIDNLGSFGGRIIGFSAGDTIDLGTSLAVGTIAFNTATGILSLEDSGGTILDSLLMATGAFASGTFAVNGGTADGFVLGTIVSNGTTDTTLTTTLTTPISTNASGSWQAAATWVNGVIPSAADTPLIGYNKPGAAFTITTGSSPVTVSAFDIINNNSTLQVTSNTTTTGRVVGVIGGLLEVTGGNTLTATALRTFEDGALVLVDAGGTVALSGHSSTGLAPIAGTLSVQQGNTFAGFFGAGTITVNGALLAGPANPAVGGGGDIALGFDSNGLPAAMNVNGGGAGSGNGVVTDTHALLASDPTSSGTLTISGAGASWTDTLDVADPGNIRGYMQVGFNNLSGNTPAGLGLPQNVAAAQLIVENGATLTDPNFASIAASANSAGSATITAGGFWNIAVNGVGGLGVGAAGSGALSVLNGGSVAVGANGSLVSVAGGLTTTVNGGIGIGSTAGAVGTLTVSGVNSQVSTLNGIAVGKAGQGTLNISNGGLVAVNGAVVNVGSAAGSSGLINLGGSGAAAVLNDAAASGGMNIGNAGAGTVIVSDSGTLNLNGTGGLTIGNASTGSGLLLVGGTTAAAVVNVGTRGITIGNSGTGTLDVEALGTIALTGTRGIGIGALTGGAGLVKVSGGLITESATGTGIGIGQAGGATGALQISNNGTVSLAGGGIAVGQTAQTADGTIMVQDPGSLLRLTGTAAITIGSAGGGTLTVTNGGSVSDANALSLGGSTGASGTVMVSGGTITSGALSIGSSGTSAGFVSVVNGVINASSVSVDADVGHAASGTLSIGAGGIVGSTGNIFINKSGTVSLSGGVLNVATTVAFGGGANANLANGATITGFGAVHIGQNDSGLLNNSGTVIAAGGTLEISAGNGIMSLQAGATLKIDGSASPGATIAYTPGALETAILGAGVAFTNNLTISSWQPLDRLELPSGLIASSATLIGNTLSVGVNGSFTGTITFSNVSVGAGGLGIFDTGTDQTTGLSFVEQVACFAAGTRIRTKDGLVAVEELVPGDTVRTARGGRGRIVWVGSRTVNCARHPRPGSVWPVRIVAGAFGRGMPERDLFLSPDHAVFVDGVLVPAKLLINGTTVRQVRRETVTYFHIELEQHDIVFAEGLPAETYLDTGDRAKFSGGSVTILHPDFAARVREMEGCAELVLTGNKLEAIRANVARGTISVRRALAELAGRRAFGG